MEEPDFFSRDFTLVTSASCFGNTRRKAYTNIFLIIFYLKQQVELEYINLVMTHLPLLFDEFFETGFVSL